MKRDRKGAPRGPLLLIPGGTRLRRHAGTLLGCPLQVTGRLFGVLVAQNKMEIEDMLWLECCENTKSGEIRRFLEVPYSFVVRKIKIGIPYKFTNIELAT